jgi:nitrate/TMAO reductase-like tetraheme cytochrome c subunit
MRDRIRRLLVWAWRHKLIVLGLVLLGLIGLVFAMHQTSGPAFCGSCHEMGYEHRTWSASSHHEVECSACHYHPGVVGMIRTKLQGAQEAVSHFRKGWTESEIGPGMAEVPSGRCLKCHAETKLPQEIAYHLLRHTHRKHLERGAECTQCHANVVHGGKAPFKNTPTMSACLKCHDGKQAPNDCSLCHLKLGEIKPALYNPAWVEHHRENIATTGRDRCASCHGEQFCRSCHAVGRPPSHTSNWVRSHADMNPKDRPQCAQCHPTRGDRPEADFCTECHTARKAHGTTYIREHPKEFQREPDACGRCHKERFCQDCHSIYMPHKTGWLAEHGAEAQHRRDSCRTCHKDHFCESCHTRGRPVSHTKDWRTTHPAVARTSSDGCRFCHPTDFCQSCHRKSPPTSHRERTWLRAHGGTALASRNSCRACHDASYCASCHRGVAMPHPSGWLHSHPASGRNPRTCQGCHQTAFCDACHRGSKPSTHDAQWGRRHGPVARTQKATCLRCHTERNCQVCHHIPMPHPKNIRSAHGTLARGEDGRYCGLCHKPEVCSACHKNRSSMPGSHRADQWLAKHGDAEGLDTRCMLCHKAKDCQDCHGLPMPHPENWLLTQHGCQTPSNAKACARCHDSDFCRTCHESTPPASHAAADFKQKHGADRSQEPLCVLCHGRDAAQKRDACQTCHRGVPMPHEDRFALKHKDVGSFDPKGTCLGCHELSYCKVCHADMSAQKQQ